MKSIKTFSLCLALCLIGFVHTAGAQTTQQPANTDDSKASCCSKNCCASGVCHMRQHSGRHHATAHNGSAMKDGDCCAHCTDACKSGGGDCCKAMGDGAQSCAKCKMGAQHKHASSHHADANSRKADCCAGCTCCATKDAAK